VDKGVDNITKPVDKSPNISLIMFIYLFNYLFDVMYVSFGGKWVKVEHVCSSVKRIYPHVLEAYRSSVSDTLSL
jgi:hypothetical protein